MRTSSHCILGLSVCRNRRVFMRSLLSMNILLMVCMVFVCVCAKQRQYIYSQTINKFHILIYLPAF